MQFFAIVNRERLPHYFRNAPKSLDGLAGQSARCLVRELDSNQITAFALDMGGYATADFCPFVSVTFPVDDGAQILSYSLIALFWYCLWILSTMPSRFKWSRGSESGISKI